MSDTTRPACKPSLRKPIACLKACFQFPDKTQVLVGNNHTADGRKHGSQLPTKTSAKNTFKRDRLKTVLGHGLDIANKQGVHQVLVAGDWNLTEPQVGEALKGIHGDWTVVKSREEQNRDWIFATCKLQPVRLSVMQAHDKQHWVIAACMPVSPRGAPAETALAPSQGSGTWAPEDPRVPDAKVAAPSSSAYKLCLDAAEKMFAWLHAAAAL